MVSSIDEGNFINRGDELNLIETAFAALHDQRLILRTPIIDFLGVGGIGKTRVLQEVRQRCFQEGFSCIWVNENQSPMQFLEQWLSRAKQVSTDDRMYLSDIASTVDPAIQEEIISWIYGYPLAMKVMSRLIREQKLDLRVQEHQKILTSLLMEQVVDQGRFARVERLEWYENYVGLLSIPQRFNLVILQDLIEKFLVLHDERQGDHE